MVSAIGTTAPVRLSAPSAAGLENQLVRYRQQLSDCVNCPSTSRTPEGQRKARELADKIGDIESRLDEAARSAADARRSQDATNSESSSLNSTTATLGNRLNVYA